MKTVTIPSELTVAVGSTGIFLQCRDASGSMDVAQIEITHKPMPYDPLIAAAQKIVEACNKFMK